MRKFNTFFESQNKQKTAEICGKSWLRGLNMGRTREVLDLLSLGKNISELMQRLSSEDMST